MGFLMIAFFSVGFTVEGSDPTKVDILLADGATFTGEILALRDSSIVVAAPAGLAESALMSGTHSIVVLPHRQILSIQTAGSSYVLLGLASGCVAGCLVGAAIGSGKEVEQKQNDTFGCEKNSEEVNNTSTGAVIGSLVGALVGLGVGNAASTKGQVLVSAAQRDFNALKGVTRYPATEPEYLKSIKP